MSPSPYVRELNPVDQPHHEQHRHRVVEARFAFQGAGDALVQARVAEEAEDRRTIGGGDDRAQQHPLQQRQTEEPCRRCSTDRGSEQGSWNGEGKRGTQHRSDLTESHAETALEQNQRQGDHPDRAGKLVVGEVDPAGAVRADRHAQPDEQHKTGDPQSPSHHRCE